MWEWKEGWDSASSGDRFSEAEKRPRECCSSGLPTPNAAQWAKVGDIGVSELIGEREREREAK